MKYLTQEQVVNLNKVITTKTGGFSGKVRDNMSLCLFGQLIFPLMLVLSMKKYTKVILKK